MVLIMVINFLVLCSCLFLVSLPLFVFFIISRGLILNLLDTSLKIGEKKVELTKNEFRILEILFTNKGKVVSREQMMKRLWDSECFVDDNTLTVNITRIRKKLDEAGVQEFITTKKGMGYLLEVE